MLIYQRNNLLFVEIVPECGIFFFGEQHSFPERDQEARTITNQLTIRGRNGVQTDLQAFVPDGRINEQKQGVEPNGKDEIRCNKNG